MGSSESKPKAGAVGGRSLIPLPAAIRSRVLFGIEEAERLKGSPGNVPEIVAVIHMTWGSELAQGHIGAFLQNMYREDLFYAD